MWFCAMCTHEAIKKQQATYSLVRMDVHMHLCIIKCDQTATRIKLRSDSVWHFFMFSFVISLFGSLSMQQFGYVFCLFTSHKLYFPLIVLNFVIVQLISDTFAKNERTQMRTH